MHSWGFSFQLNASRNKISEKWVHPSWLRSESFSKEIFTGKILLAPSPGLQFKFGFHFAHFQQCENPSKVTVFSKKVPNLQNVLVFPIQRNFKVQCKLAFLALTDCKQQSPYLYSGLKGFPLMEIFTRVFLTEWYKDEWAQLYCETLHMQSMLFISFQWFLPKAAKQDSNKFLKVQHHFLFLLLKV